MLYTDASLVFPEGERVVRSRVVLLHVASDEARSSTHRKSKPASVYQFQKVIFRVFIGLGLNVMTISCAPRQEVQKTTATEAAKAPCICVKNFDPVCHLPSQQTFGNQCEALCDTTHRPEELKPGPCHEN